MKPFHYVNVDARAPSYQRERDCKNGCVVTALAQFIALLESDDPPLSLAERRRAIYWTAHFMGDIHQPVHIAHPDGRGGRPRCSASSTSKTSAARIGFGTSA